MDQFIFLAVFFFFFFFFFFFSFFFFLLLAASVARFKASENQVNGHAEYLTEREREREKERERERERERGLKSCSAGRTAKQIKLSCQNQKKKKTSFFYI